MKYGDFVSHSKPFNLPVEQIRKIQALVGTSQISQITEVLNDIFSRVKAAEYGVDYLEKCANAFSTYITDYYARLLPDSLETENNRDIRSVYNFDSIDDYLLALRNYLSSLDGYVQMLKTQYKESNKMEEVLSWLEANFANPNLSMSMAANQISLNYTYFSMVFREHTGMSFVNYLKKLRIQKARELIERRVYKVSQVATMTGFHNPRLFSRTFREETGITPAEYICKAALLGRFAGHS
jgi:two-component system response regulator YesN